MKAIRVGMTLEQLWQRAPGGSGTYIRELLHAMPGSAADVDTIGLAARHQRPDELALTVPVYSSSLPRTILYEAWNRFRSPRVPSPELDVLHATTWAVPPRSRPLVVTVHDLAFLRTPEHFTPRGVDYFRRALRIVEREADLVLVPSQTTADDCSRHGITSDRLRLVPHGVAPPHVTTDAVTQFQAKHALRGPYVLWCGTLEPRKNLGTLVAAFERVAAVDPDVQLALAGPDGWGNAGADLARLLGGPVGKRVVRLGRLSDDELAAAYSGARGFCFPSLWEGFGMPVLEAMAYGVPVVTSADTSMAEFASGAALLVDPLDPAALAEAILEAIGPAHDILSELASGRAQKFSWRDSAAATAQAYRDVK